MAIRIPFIAEISSLLRGTRDAGRALDEVADSLDDVVGEARRAGDLLGDHVSDGAREAARGTERLERSFRDMSRTAASESRDAGRDIERNVGDGFNELKDEAGQSGREAAASFSGGFDDVGDFLQETIANGLAGFGPLGAAGGIALAVAAGVGFEQMRLDAEATERRVDDMFSGMLESGSRWRNEEAMRSATQAIAQDAEQWAKALERQADSGVEVGTILRAMAGDLDAAATVRQSLADKAAAERDAIQAGADSEQIKADRIDAVNTKLEASTEWLDQIIGDTDTAAAKAAAVASSWESVNTQAQQLRDKVAEVVRDLEKVGKGVTIPIRADTTGLEGALAGMQGRSITVDVQGNITRIGNHTWD